MTYFNYRSSRGTRGEDVYEGSTLLGRVVVKRDWRSRLTLSQSAGDDWCATRLDGEQLPDVFVSRHDAAEALFALGASGQDEGTSEAPVTGR